MFHQRHDKVTASGKWLVIGPRKRLCSTHVLATAEWRHALFCATEYEIRAVKIGTSTARIKIIYTNDGVDFKEYPGAGSISVPVSRLASMQPSDIALFTTLGYTIAESWEMTVGLSEKEVTVESATLTELVSRIEAVEFGGTENLSHNIKSLGLYTRKHITHLLEGDKHEEKEDEEE